MNWSWTPALSKVEFIMTGAAITMFFVKLVFLLNLSSVVPEIYFGIQFCVDGFGTMVSSKQIFFLPQSLTTYLGTLFQYFQTWFKTVISMTRKMKIVNSLYEWNVIMIVWMKLDCVNKLNNISRHKFRFLKYFDTFLSK